MPDYVMLAGTTDGATVAKGRSCCLRSAVHSLDGDDFASWSQLPGVFYREIGANDETLVPFATCCGYDTNLAVDGVSGEIVLAWYSNMTDEHGTYTKTIFPIAAETRFVPRSAYSNRSQSIPQSTRIPITGRVGFPGVFVAHCGGYPTCKNVRLWRHDTATDLLVAPATGAKNRAIAADASSGKLWVFWRVGTKIHGALSRPNAVEFPHQAYVQAPNAADAEHLWSLVADAGNGSVDLFLLTSGSGKAIAYHLHMTQEQFKDLAAAQSLAP
jgi:hypothetical protein